MQAFLEAMFQPACHVDASVYYAVGRLFEHTVPFRSKWRQCVECSQAATKIEVKIEKRKQSTQHL